MDLTFKNIPDAIGEKQATEWMSILVERFHNAQVNSIPAVVQAAEAAKSGIDAFREANALTPKFRKVEEKPVEVKDVVEEAVIRG